MILAVFGFASALVILLLALFEPGLSYRTPEAIDISPDSAEFAHLLAVVADAHLHNDTVFEVLTNGDRFYDAELATIPLVHSLKSPRRNRGRPRPWPARSSFNTRFGPPTRKNVPSVIIGERNYVLNPAHSDFARIEFAQPETFRFDLRLISRKPPLTDKEARRELV